MVRRTFIAGNWKMNLDRQAAVALVRELVEQVGPQSRVDLAVCPPAVYLEAVAGLVAGSPIGLGAQNMYHETSGAFTGELSPAMLVDVGCRYVILGHSERRQYFGESNEDVFRKAQAALAAGLTPIVCLGERLDEREAGRTREVVEGQFRGSLAGLSADEIQNVVIAYEPVWAIGTGKVATPEQAEEVHAALRSMLENRYNAGIAERIVIQYGGSVKPDNAAQLLGQPNIDGALVGGASLTASGFLGIANAAP
ncbi:MAG: triose-phosphate isomerase [Pirellulaceae bacterium]|nr:triose-phosphate isomerase [Pirellulaceae bacterium]